jgi:hypothetical protein
VAPETLSIVLLLASGVGGLDVDRLRPDTVLASGSLSQAIPDKVMSRNAAVHYRKADVIAQWFNGWGNGFFNCFQGYWRSC